MKIFLVTRISENKNIFLFGLTVKMMFIEIEFKEVCVAITFILKEHVQIVQIYMEKFNVTVFRGSRPEVFYKKIVLENFTKFTVKHLYQIFAKVCGMQRY